MQRCAVLLTLLILTGCWQSDTPEFDASEYFPGGKATASRLSKISYVKPGGNVGSMQRLNYWTGFSLFRDPWVIAPSSTTDRDGLGPLFNTRACVACHVSGSRGTAPKEGTHMSSSLVLRLSSRDGHKYQVNANYGEQIHGRSISKKLQPEAKVNVQYELITGAYPDGQSYQLQRPSYQLKDLAYGAISDAFTLSPRYAPNIYGMGLLDAIPEQTLITQEDPFDADNDGVSARYNRVPDALSGKKDAIGRFGFKAKHPTLAQQVAAAFRDDIGITNMYFPTSPCAENQQYCDLVDQQTLHSKSLEIVPKLLDLVIEFSQLVAVPPARTFDREGIMQGRDNFFRAECDTCHVPSYTTSEGYPVKALANQKIWPYTDLALHDMGSGLADNAQEYLATGTEWRTPPLWGIGLQQVINPKTGFLHDGRARTIEEAILWHGGEAQRSVDVFINFSAVERKQLLSFLKTI